jgi:hypothetical protein
MSTMESTGTKSTPSDEAREREQSRERKAAAWILVLAMAISAIVALLLTAYFQRP